MTSPELQWAKDLIAADREHAGVRPDRFDVNAMRAANTATRLPLPPGTVFEYVDAGGAIACWVIAPEADLSRRVVYLHGGGLVSGGLHSHRSLVSWLSHEMKAAILFVEYRLAPEHRYPAGLDDAVAATRYVMGHGPKDIRNAPRQFYLGGDSAGAGLAIATALRLRDAGERGADAIFSLCGMFDFDEKTSKFLQTSQRTRDMCRAYVHWLKDLQNPLVSVVNAKLHGLPPILLHTGTDDYCQDDSVVMASKIKAAKGTVELEVWESRV